MNATITMQQRISFPPPRYLTAVTIVWRTLSWSVLVLIKVRLQPSPTDSSLLMVPKIKPKIVAQPSHLVRLHSKKSQPRHNDSMWLSGGSSHNVYLATPSCWPRTQVLRAVGRLQSCSVCRRERREACSRCCSGWQKNQSSAARKRGDTLSFYSNIQH